MLQDGCAAESAAGQILLHCAPAPHHPHAAGTPGLLGAPVTHAAQAHALSKISCAAPSCLSTPPHATHCTAQAHGVLDTMLQQHPVPHINCKNSAGHTTLHAAQAQVMSEAAAAQRLKAVLRRGATAMPVMFFGTLEVAWVSGRDTVAWAEGVNRGLLNKCAMRYRRAFDAGVEQVCGGHMGVVQVDPPLSCAAVAEQVSGMHVTSVSFLLMVPAALSCFPRAPATPVLASNGLCRRLAVGQLQAAAFIEALRMQCRASAIHGDG